jgi:hypothetical protein
VLKAVSCLLATAALIAAPSLSSAQVNTNFAGQWELIEGIPDAPLFRDGRIEQSAGTITMTTAAPNALFKEPRVFRLDGAETIYTHQNVRGDETWALMSRARWSGATLEVTTVTTRSGAFISKWDSQMTLALDDAGRLVLTRVEPTLQGTRATLRAVYRKK